MWMQSLFTIATLVSAVLPLPFATWKRLGDAPVLEPFGTGFAAKGVFNPTVVKRGGEYVMLFRAQDAKGTSRLGYASSSDGVHFTPHPEPVLSPEAEYERNGGVEDPRVVLIGDTYYLTYTGYNTVDAQLCLATSKDLVHWDRKGVIMPAKQGRWNIGWTKSGAILTERVNGKYWMYYMADAKGKPDQTGVAYSDDLLHWTEALDHPVLPRRAGRFDSRVTEPGPAPIMTKEGIWLIYNGADDKLVYRTGWALFDRTDPTKLLRRSGQPVFKPERSWERVGQVPNVVFVEGMVRDARRYLFYYGGADRTVGVASAPVTER